jgi:hypothetical protein
MAADQNIILGIKGQDQGALALFQAAQKELAEMGAEQKRLNMELRQYDKIAQQANKVTRNSNGNYKEANRTSRMARGGIGQLGYQIQDVAVQIQGGQNLGLILGQQGSQIASVFGTGGIVAGAIISIGALIATTMVPKLFEMGQEGKKLEKIFKDLNDTLMTVNSQGVYTLTEGFEELAKSSRDYAEIVLQSKLIAAMEATQAAQSGLKNEIEEFLFVQAKTGNAVRGNEVILKRFASEMGVTAEQALELRQATIAVQNGTEGAATALVSLLSDLSNTGNASEEFIKIAAAAGKFAMDAEEAARFTTAIQDALGDLDGALKNNTEEQEGFRDALKETIEKMRREVAAYGMSERVIALRDAALQGANETQLREIDILQERLEVMKQQEDAEKLMTDILGKTGTARDQYLTKYREQLDELNKYRDDDIISDEEYTASIINLARQRADNLAKYAEQDMKTRMESVNFIGQAASQMESAFEDGSKAQKAAFLVNQGIQVANAIVNTNAAATAALGMPPFTPANIALSGMVKAMGYASAAAIAGQAIGSFEGGGFTGMGSRTGGVDGKGGFAAILHPNETVIDHTKGQGSGMNVTVNINAVDTKGFDELLYKRRGQLVSIINQAVNNRGRASIV